LKPVKNSSQIMTTNSTWDNQMKIKFKLFLLTAVAALGLATSAHAGFINGGFETGDFTGWTLEHGSNFGGTVAFTPGDAGHAYVVGSGYDDPYSSFDSPFNRNYMARLNEFNPNFDATRISQTGTMLAGETDVFVNWGAVVEDPNHSISEQPYFDITILRNGLLFANENHNASQGATGGWLAGLTGPNFSPTYYSSGVFHVSGLVAGDEVTVLMTAADCAQGGHSGWAYLDGIGTVQQPPGQSVPTGQSVPDGGSTMMLMGMAFAVIGGIRKFKH
jgi:hypothetical protein